MTGPQPSHTLTFQVTPQDAEALWRWSYTYPVGASSPAEQQRTFRKNCTLIAFGATVPAAFAWYELIDEGHPIGFLAGLLTLAALAVWQVRWQVRASAQARAVNTQLQGWLSSGVGQLLLGHTKVTISLPGVHVAKQYTQECSRWDAIESVHRLPNAIYILRVDGYTVAIPRSAFESEEHMQSVADDLLAWVNALSPHADARRLERYLASNQVLCPTCKYNLRGVTQTKCPECGLVLDRTTLPAAWA